MAARKRLGLLAWGLLLVATAWAIPAGILIRIYWK